jgi:hypothetical protein
MCIQMIEFSEEVYGEKFHEQADDRITLALSPIIAALFTQAKYRYKAQPASTVIVAATTVRNFALADGLSDLALVDSVCEFMHMMRGGKAPMVDIGHG